MEPAVLLQWLTRRETIVVLAIAGGALSIASSLAGAGRVPRLAAWCNVGAYAFMGTSMLLFVVAGLR